MKIKIFYYSLLIIASSCHKKPLPPAPLPPSVKVATVKMADTPRFHTYVGHIEPSVQVEVRSQVEGQLMSYYFIEGQEVQPGALLFDIDSRPYEAQLAKAEAALSYSLANLKLAEDTAFRNAKLVEQDYVAKLQYDQYVTNIETARANIQQAKADIDSAKINISYCKIHSPILGITGKLQLNVGNLIDNAGQTPLVVLNQIRPIYAYFSVPQTDLPEIMRLQQIAPLEVEAYLNGASKKSFFGKLNLIDNQVNTKTGSIWMRAVFPNEDKQLWPGEFVELRLILEIEKNALLVPIEAIQYGQKHTSLFILTPDQRVELRTITLGQRLGDEVVITSGLKPREIVVTEGQINLTPGMKVSIQP